MKDLDQQHEAAPALVKTVTVPVDPNRAFELFTGQLASWWPLDTHSVGRTGATTVSLDGRVGGQIVETIADGRHETWGTISDWEPPRLVSFSWHPGTPAEEATQVTVRFTESAEGTDVELVHSGWDNRPDSVAARRMYDSGWDYVLGRYIAHT